MRQASLVYALYADLHSEAYVQEVDGEEDVIDVDLGEASCDWRPSPCHRLDVGTGGLMLVAKSRRAAADMCRQLKERKVKKTYHAVVVGLVQVRSRVKLSM